MVHLHNRPSLTGILIEANKQEAVRDRFNVGQIHRLELKHSIRRKREKNASLRISC